MSIVAQSEQDQIVPIHLFVTLASQGIELFFIFLSGDLRVDFAAHAEDHLIRDLGGDQKTLTSHPIVALIIVRWNTAFIAEGDSGLVPWEGTVDLCEARVNWTGCISAR